SFTVADPTWIWYDQGGTTYLGFTPGTSNITTFGPTVLFENPFFGTGIPMKLNATDGSSYYGNTANLHVYSYDGVTMTDLITPLPVVFGAQTYDVFDLTAYNILINTEYFLVAYEDIPVTATGSYILWDDTYNYGTSYCRILSNVHTNALYTLTRSGSWAIGVNVQSGPAGMDAPVVTIAMGTGGPELSWNAVAGAMSYNVYGSADPYAAAPWTMLGNTVATSWTYTGTDMLNFFQVKADTNAPPRAAVNGLKKSFDRSNVRSAAVQNAPKNRFGLRGIRN
ncbi:MAG: hypothetical protein Q8M66_09355, partial [Actinomycetota bacterium]|nr:hypothetical protein [Actinomycetota bacterium]